MQSLSYITAYMHRQATPPKGARPIAINLITNFTDDVLERIIGGMCLTEGIYPSITRAPYKQYGFAFKDKKSPINRTKADVTFIFFDASHYRASEFLQAGASR
jgi:predicted enzyme involved in methoxymalonyl-ACP biosynthesis